MNSPPTTRASLIGRLSDPDDVSAWGQFVEIYGPLVYRMARRMGLQPADADDLVQEVLARVSRSVGDWTRRTNRGPFRSWLFRTARNAAINLLTRRRYRTLSAGGGRSVEGLSRIAACDAESVELEYRRETFRWAAENVRPHMSETSWDAFWKTAVDGQPACLVAEQLQITVGAVYIARSRAMARIRELIATLEKEPFDE